MNYLAAAIQVLRASNVPLTTRELTVRVIEEGLVVPGGKTPEATMSAELYRYVRRHPDGEIERKHGIGKTRAERGSVRWMAKDHSGPA